MKLKLLLFSAVLATSLQADAQWVMDSVSMGPNYGNDIYYSMKNGAVGSPVLNTDWHLGFEMVPGGPGYGGVSIIANHVQGKVNIYSLHKTASSFGTLSLPADTMPSARTQLYNADSSWDWGAFNTNTAGSVFDYGWGKYNVSTHHVDGDSLYMVNIGNKFYKMTISHYHGTPTANIYYAFHIAEMDNTNDILDTIKRTGYENKNFAYYSLTSNNDFSRDPDKATWDILFTRYIEYVSMGPGPKVPYPVAGILSNMAVNVAEARKVDPETAVYTSYSFNKNMCEMGSDWKTFNTTTFQYEYDTVSYFVKTRDTAVYQIKFTKFESGSGPTGTGKFVFAKRIVAFPASVGELSKHITAHTMVPNPAANETSMVLESEEAVSSARFIVTDVTGKTIMNNVVSLKKGMNALSINTSNYNAGTYFVTVTNGDWKVNEKLVVQH